MPQPLSRKFPSGCKYRTGAGAMVQRPELAVKFANVISSWAQVEIEMATAMCEAMQASAEPFAAAFQALNSTAAQASVADAAIKAVIDNNLIPVFDVLMGLFYSAKKVRDRIAHNAWGWTDRLPNALLWIDAKRLVMRESQVVKTKRLSEDGKSILAECGSEFAITGDHVMVYEAKDFDEAIHRNMRTAFLFTRFSLCVWPVTAKDPTILHQLLNEPEIAEGLARLEKNQSRKK